MNAKLILQCQTSSILEYAKMVHFLENRFTHVLKHMCIVSCYSHWHVFTWLLNKFTGSNKTAIAQHQWPDKNMPLKLILKCLKTWNMGR